MRLIIDFTYGHQLKLDVDRNDKIATVKKLIASKEAAEIEKLWYKGHEYHHDENPVPMP